MKSFNQLVSGTKRKRNITSPTHNKCINKIINIKIEYLTHLKHGLKTFKGVLDTEGAEVVDEPLRVEEVGVYNSTLDVVLIGVVFQSPL